MDAEALIDEYLHALMTEAQRLPGAQAVELVSDVRDHLNSALAEAGTSDEATVRNILERLGTPDAIVAASLPASEAVAAAPNSSMGNTEIAAVLLMTVGSVVVPVFAPLAGIYFARTSTKWSARTKKRATWLGALSAAWAPLLTVLFLLAFTQRPLIQSVVNLLPGVQYESLSTERSSSLAACNVLQPVAGGSATTPNVHTSLQVVSDAESAEIRPAEEIPTEWLGTSYGELVTPVNVDDSWRVLRRPLTGQYIGVVHISPSTETPGWITADVVARCGGTGPQPAL